jgi:anti-sigma regulatory factor (Ser/Thr protein kinase)
MMARRAFEPSESSVGAARHFVAATITDIDSELRDCVSLMVSELSTNALVHAAGDFEVTVDRSDRDVFVSVRDQGIGQPVLQSPDASDPHGRGLRIVDALSDEWGISAPSGTGKTVWFRVWLHSSASGASADGTVGVQPTGAAPEAGPSPARPTTPVVPQATAARTPASRHPGPRRRTRVNSDPSVAPTVARRP